LEDGKDILPVFGRAAVAAKVATEGKKIRKVLLLGSGFVARPCAEYVVRDPSNELTIGRSIQSVPCGEPHSFHSMPHAPERTSIGRGSSKCTGNFS
jgi:spermidine synthase